MLQIPPVEMGVHLQGEGHDSGRDGRAGAGPRVSVGALAVQVSGGDLALAVSLGSGAEGGCQARGARLRVPGNLAVFRGRAYAQCEGGSGVAIGVAVVLKLSSVSGRPQKD